MTKEIQIGNVKIGAGNPIAIQSMANADTCDNDAVVRQIAGLESAGCEIVSVAAYSLDAARSIKSIKDRIAIPLVADVHFDSQIAVAAMEAGADKVRINPGNIGSEEKIRRVVDAAKLHHIPLRVGANTGSLKKGMERMNRADALVQSALSNIRVLEAQGFYNIVVSLKSSDVADTVRAYRKMHALVDYPLHLGVTEAGVYGASIVKSSIGIGALLLDGIGDTLRVSITGSLADEIRAAKQILQYAGRRAFGPEVIACPTCARTSIDVAGLAKRVTEATAHIAAPVKIAVMGCVVNGPGEARHADVGIAGGDGEGLLFIKGNPVKKLKDDEMLPALIECVKKAAEELR